MAAVSVTVRWVTVMPAGGCGVMATSVQATPVLLLISSRIWVLAPGATLG